MLSGFNTNFRYRGVLFHVQTEDSGRDNPHVITHLFHGGNIMASEKRDYRDLLAEAEGPALEEGVRKMMEGQHKTMLKQLSSGEHDLAIEQRMGPDVFREPESATTPPPASVTQEDPPAARAATADALASQPAAARAAASQRAADPDRTERLSHLSRVFGDRVVSEKPLDEVVLDYLVENARKRKRPSTK